MERLRRLSIGVLLLLLVVMAGILYLGSQQMHQGQLVFQKTEPPDALLVASSAAALYKTELKSHSKLFRGSDLFVVSEVSVEPNSKIDADTIKLDPAFNHGVVSFSSSNVIDQSQPIPATFQLQIYERNVYPALVGVSVLLSLLFAAPWHQRLPEQHLLKSKKPTTVFAVTCMLAVLFALVGSNVATPGWTYGDCHQFLSTTVQGDMMGVSVYPSVGRFFPLGLLDNNLLIPFGNSPLAYQIERSILLCIVVASMFVLTWRMSNVTFASLATLLFLTAPDLFLVYSESIFPEALLLVFLTMFFLLYHRATSSTARMKNQVFAALAACLCAAVATYCKEPVFGLLLIFSCVQVLFGFKKQTTSALAIHGFVVINAIVFVSLYWLWCSGGQNYAALRAEGSGATVMSMFLQNFGSPMAILALVIAVYRMWRLLVGRDREFLFSDGLLLAGIGYGFAFCLMKLGSNYYVVPSHACWAIAMAGYFKKVEVNAPSHAKRFFRAPAPSFMAKCVTCVAVAVVILQVVGTRKSIKRLVVKRQDCKELCRVFSQLETEGYSLFLFAPEELTGQTRMVHNWRRNVLNIFSKLERSTVSQNQEPVFSFANLDQINQVQGKKIVICPPELEGAFCSGNIQKQSWQRVIECPLVMGARIFAQDDRVADLSAVAAGDTTTY